MLARHRQAGVSIALFAGALLSACAPIRPDIPRARLGCLPFPGPMTLYHTADTSNFGEHCYGPYRVDLSTPEEERGIVYTRRAGFLDLAHLREAVDWTRYVRGLAVRALQERRAEVRFMTFEETGIVLALHYPEWWDGAEDAERRAIIDEAAMRIGQRSAMLIGTWHEIVTWYGWRTFAFVDERGSSFTYEDEASHLVGLRVARRAIEDSSRGYDDAVTAAIVAEFDDLGIVPTACARRAVMSVEGRWWSNGVAIRRNLDTGLDGAPVTPWTVGPLDCCDEQAVASLIVPTLENVRGRDLAGLVEFRLEPSPWLMSRLYGKGAPVRPLDARADIAALIERVRADFKAEYGPLADTPAPADPSQDRLGI